MAAMPARKGPGSVRQRGNGYEFYLDERSRERRGRQVRRGGYATEEDAALALALHRNQQRRREHFVDAPYKLFEAVPGVVLNVSGSRPGRPVFVELEVTTPTGRRFWYRASARASRQGIARVRVPYAAEAYAVRTDSGIYQVAVGEEQVVSGQELEVR